MHEIMTFDKYRETVIEGLRNNGGIQLSFVHNGDEEIRADADGNLSSRKWVEKWFGIKSGYEHTPLSDEEFEKLIELDFERSAEYNEAKVKLQEGSKAALERFK